jgi:Zn-dependent M28 family amino/carboxypeptidase
MAGRKFASSESKQAQNYIISSLENSNVLPFQNEFRHPFIHKTFMSERQGNNIIGFVQGSLYPKKYIVLSAHYDHLGRRGSKIYNGADDNASGVAALLTYGDVIAKKPLKHTVIFLFTDAEELNLQGSRAFIHHQKRLLPRILLNINIDMIAGSSRTRTLHFIDNRLSSILNHEKIVSFNALSKKHNINIKHGFNNTNTTRNTKSNWINASDHGSFNRERIPFIYFGVGEHKNYHTYNDSFTNVNLPFYIQASHAIYNYLLFFDENI